MSPYDSGITMSRFFAAADSDAPSLPDWDDLGPTLYDALPPLPPEATRDALDTMPPTELASQGAPEPPRQSFVRMRTDTGEGHLARFLDAASEKQLNLGVNLVCLEHEAVGLAQPHVLRFDRSIQAASDTLRARVAELGELRDALEQLCAEAADAPELAPLFAADAPLTAFVGGLYVCCDEVLAALFEVARGLRALGPEWSRVRRRLERAAEWYFDGLAPEIRDDVARMASAPPGTRARFGECLEELFWAASVMERGLEKRFG